MSQETARAVRFDSYGDRDVLYVTDIPMPVPAAGEVLIAVRAAGINPGEAAIRTGVLHERFPATFPSGQGSDLAGVVVALADEVDGFAVGDEVLGFSWTRSSHSTHTAVPANQLIHKPAQMSWEVAGAFYVVACTAYAAVSAVEPGPSETIAVSAASGGVGSIVVQLLKQHDVHVLGIASPSSESWLTAQGATPVDYGDGLADRLRAAAPGGIDAFIDLFGAEYVRVAVELGIARNRIETIAAFDVVEEFGIQAKGSVDASTPEVLAEMAGYVSDGKLTVPIAATYPLEEVKAAFAQLEQRHTHGKIVLIP